MTINFWDVISELADACEKANEEREKEKAQRREEFEEQTNPKVYNRGTVISAMAENGFDSYGMKKVLKVVQTSEQAEAAVGLINAGYDWYAISEIVESI